MIPDETASDIASEEDWGATGKRVQLARLELPERSFAYRYRLVASIVLAEAARQVGTKARKAQRISRIGLEYESALRTAATEGQDLTWDELSTY